jgi:hypothetical protein
MNCGTVTARSGRWRIFERPSLGVVLGAVAAWVILVTALHTTINSRGPLAPGAEARALQVGGLPVT